MKIISYIFGVLIIGIPSCQNVDRLVNSIAEKNIVECEVIGFSGSPSSVYQEYEKLKSIVSKEKLLELTNHDSLAVVGYASYALIDRALVEPHQLFERFIVEDKNVRTFCGCIMSSSSMSSLIYHRYWNTRVVYEDETAYEEPSIKDSKELQKLDSLILYSKKPDWILLSRAFENRVYEDTYNPKIEEWAFVRNDYYAMKYVYQNLLEGNRSNLEAALKKYLEGEEIYEAQRKAINQMLKAIKRKN